jgi:ribosomal protein S18 acetylase RimI-like enzyme
MIEKSSLQRAAEILAQEEEQNRYPLLRLEQGGIGECWLCGDSVCLWDQEHNKYCYAVNSENELLELYGFVSRRKGALVSLMTNRKWVSALQEVDDTLQATPCTQLRAQRYAQSPPAVPGVLFGDVTREVAEWMLTVYEHPELSVNFIMQRAMAAPAVAAFSSGRPIGFFLTHSNAELGPVYTEPAYRGSGLADALYAAMTARLPNEASAPVLFVLPENHASQKWLRRMGCTPAPEEVAWFWRG